MKFPLPTPCLNVAFNSGVLPDGPVWCELTMEMGSGIITVKCIWIDLFKLSLSNIIQSDKSRSIRTQSFMEVELYAASYFLRGLNNHKLRWTSLTTRVSFITPPVKRIFCDFPVDVSRWCASVMSARCVSLTGYFGHFKSKLYFFCWILSVGAPLKSCSKVVRLALYVGIFQFYCTWKIDNCRIFRLNLRFVYKILRWAALSWLVEKTPRDLMQIYDFRSFPNLF